MELGSINKRAWDACLSGPPPSVNIFFFHPFTCNFPSFCFLYSRILVHCTHVLHFHVLVSVEGHIGCFCFPALINRVALDMAEQGSTHEVGCVALWIYPKECHSWTTLGPHASFTSSPLRLLLTISQFPVVKGSPFPSILSSIYLLVFVSLTFGILTGVR